MLSEDLLDVDIVPSSNVDHFEDLVEMKDSTLMAVAMARRQPLTFDEEILETCYRSKMFLVDTLQKVSRCVILLESGCGTI